MTRTPTGRDRPPHQWVGVDDCLSVPEEYSRTSRPVRDRTGTYGTPIGLPSDDLASDHKRFTHRPERGVGPDLLVREETVLSGV